MTASSTSWTRGSASHSSQLTHPPGPARPDQRLPVAICRESEPSSRIQAVLNAIKDPHEQAGRLHRVRRFRHVVVVHLAVTGGECGGVSHPGQREGRRAARPLVGRHTRRNPRRADQRRLAEHSRPREALIYDHRVKVPASFPRYPTSAQARDAVKPRQGLVRWWWGAFRPRTAVFASPLPPAECGRRLAAATTRDLPGGYLRRLVAGKPASRRVGDVSPSRVRVAQPPQERRWQPWFEGVISPAPHGGTIVRGTVGLTSSGLVTLRVFSVMVAFVIAVLTASGLESTVSGSGPGPAMLVVPGFLTAFYLSAWAVSAWQTQTVVELLKRELSEILGAADSS